MIRIKDKTQSRETLYVVIWKRSFYTNENLGNFSKIKFSGSDIFNLH